MWRRTGRSPEWRGPAASPGGGLKALSEVVETLWPGAEVHSGGAAPDGARVTFVALPSPARATLLLPLRPSRATAAVLQAHRTPGSLRQRLRHALLVAFARVGAAHLVPHKVTVVPSDPRAPDDLYTWLGAIVGGPVSLGIHLGPPRANRKPVLQLMDDHGRTVAFAKVGINELTRELVRAETGALTSLENPDFSCLTIPHILRSGQWREHELLVLAPVDTRSTSRSRPRLLQRAMVELSTSQGHAREVLVRSAYWKQLRCRVENLPGPHTVGLLAAVTSVEVGSADLDVPLGAWHGDWTPWNMATRGDRVVLWDWERFCVGVPLGFDALHFELQSTIRRRRLAPYDAVSAITSRAAPLLAPFGVAAREAPLVTATYLIEIGARYLHDRQQEAGSRVGDISAWLLPHLPALLDGASAAHQA